MRILALLAAFLVSCGGGGSSVTTETIVLDKPGQIVVIPGERARFKLLFLRFFECVRNGHGGAMLHANLTGSPKGAGVSFGLFDNTTYVTRNIPKLQPVAVPETWSGIEGYDSLFAQGATGGLRDGVEYEVSIESTSGRLSYTWNGVTTELVDANPNIDYSLNNIAFFLAAAEGVCPFSVVITPVTP